MTLSDAVTWKIIKSLIKGEDYRIEVTTLLNAQFLDYTLEFFIKVIEAKLRGETVTIDWYRESFLDKESVKSDDFMIYAGLNRKTISNMYNTARREVVVKASLEHFETLYKSISELIDNQNEIDVKLTLTYKDVSVNLNINETLIVINSLAVKRAALRGGLWSTAGKRVEKPLMVTLCQLFNVPPQHYPALKLESLREVDFYLQDVAGNNHRCEVKLMGKGNPESADVIQARNPDVFIADKLSELAIQQLETARVEWVELRRHNGYQRFYTVLQNLNIPANPFTGNLEARLDEIFTDLGLKK